MSKRVSRIWIVLLVLLTVGASFAAVRMLRSRSVRAAESAPTETWTCTPDLVVSANVRVVAHCNTGYNTNIRWFAYPTSDSANASRMLSVFETAKATGSTLTFYFDPNDLSGAAYGCLTGDCRAIWAVTTP